MEDSIIDREDSRGDLHDPGLEGERDGGVAGAELDLHQAPDAVRQLHALVDHVLALERPLSNRERLQVFKIMPRQPSAMRHRTHVVLRHFRADAIAGALHPLDGVLDLVGRRDVLPRVQECLLLHRS